MLAAVPSRSTLAPPHDATPRWVPVLGVALTSLIILLVMNPRLLLAANTPSGGDMGAHVLAPAFLRESLLPQGRLLGWSNSWFAGFPIFYFYFPLPSVVIVLLDLLLPYGVAFKLVTVVGLLALPPAAYFLARSLRMDRATATTAAAAAGAFVFMESYSIYGANIASTLAGEFSFSWSFALSLVYLGLLIRTVRDDRRWAPWAALALALTALSHVLTVVVVVVASLPVLLWARGARRAPAVWGLGFALAGFWALPLVVRIGLSSDMAWTPLRRWEELFPVELWLLLLPALVGMVWATRRTPRTVPVITLTFLPVVYYWLPVLLPRWWPEVFTEERWKLWNGRLLPYWYFGVHFFAGVAAGLLLVALTRRLPERLSAWWGRALLAVGVAVAAVVVRVATGGRLWALWLTLALGVVALSASAWLPARIRAHSLVLLTAVVVLAGGGVAGVSMVDGWARWNYSGYEGKDGWPEYQALMETMDGLPPGRVQWEANRDLNRYGTPMSLMLFPYWTGDHPSMEGLFFESSLTTPFHFLNAAEMSVSPSNPIPGLRYHTFDFDRGVRHLGVYDVRYYVSFTEEATNRADSHAGLDLVAQSPPFSIYELPESSLVDVATRVPVVYEAPPANLPARFLRFLGRVFGDREPASETFHDLALRWYDDIGGLDQWVVADGPPDWPRVDALGDEFGQFLVEGGEVSDVVVEDERVFFRTTAVGVPHLVKVSYFPNWTAVGADGPYRAAPSLMVVVPRQQEVTLEFRSTWAEQLGVGLTIAGALVLLASFLATRRNEP